MEKLSIVNNISGNKKIFIRKEIEASRLGDSVYEDDVLSQYTVYLVRKFEQGIDYNSQEQFKLLLDLLPEEFNTYFDHFVLKKMYIRSTSNSVYISLFLALASPLVKAQMNELRKWIGDLIVPEISLEHTSNFIDQGNPIDVTRGLQETNSEVLLLSEMINQFGQNLTEVFDEVKHLKEKKVPPVVKVVPSEALAKQSVETENSQHIKKLKQNIEQLTADFSNFKEEVIEIGSKSRKIPKFKVLLGPGSEEKSTLESRLELAINKVESLTKEIQEANSKIAILDNKVLESSEKLASKSVDHIKKDHMASTEDVSVEELTEQHKKDQELLKINATEIKKLTQTVGKVDVELIQAHQKIGELEQKMRHAAKYEQQQTLIIDPQSKMSAEGTERAHTFLHSVKHAEDNDNSSSNLTETTGQHRGVTLAIEEVLDRVSEKHPSPAYTKQANYVRPAETTNRQRNSKLKQLKKIEWDIHAIFQKNTGAGHKGMVSKQIFRTNLKKMDVLPYLWNSVYEKKQRDIMLGDDLSCQNLINELDNLLEEAKHVAQKRKLMGKWVYCPKEIEQKMEGYKLLNDYLELCLEL